MYPNQSKASLLPYLLCFCLLDIVFSILIAVFVNKSVGILVSSMAGAFITSHLFFRQQNRFFNQSERLMLSFFNILIVFVASFTIIYFLIPNQAKIVISTFKTGFFIGALIGLSFYKLLANFLSIKLYH